MLRQTTEHMGSASKVGEEFAQWFKLGFELGWEIEKTGKAKDINVLVHEAFIDSASSLTLIEAKHIASQGVDAGIGAWYTRKQSGMTPS